MANLLQNLAIPVLALVGLVVLVALGKVSANVGIPLIVAIAGVHTGATIATPNGNRPPRPPVQ